MEKLTDDEIGSLIYFWEDKRDLERWSDFEKLMPKIQAQFPEVLKAWEDYKMSIRIMNAVIKSL